MPKKRSVKKSVLPVFYVFCEGEKTEPFYLDHYVKDHCLHCGRCHCTRFKLSDVWKVDRTTRTDPNSLVMRAIRQKEKSPRNSGDQFWCIYDREPECGIREDVHLKALRLAEDNGIRIALSNICFEVWLLLHKQDFCAPYVSCDDLLKRSKLKQLIVGYAKGNRLSFSTGEIANARKTAKRMLERDCEVADQGAASSRVLTQMLRTNPSTNVYCLLDAIDLFFE